MKRGGKRKKTKGKKKKSSKKKIPKARDKAVTINLPYALKQIKEKINGEASEAKISVVRKTQAGNVLEINFWIFPHLYIV